MISVERFVEAFVIASDEVMESDIVSPRLDQRIADLGLDSLSQLELVSRLENELGVQIDNDRLTGVRTVGDLYAAVVSHVPVGKNGA